MCLPFASCSGLSKEDHAWLSAILSIGDQEGADPSGGLGVLLGCVGIVEAHAYLLEGFHGSPATNIYRYPQITLIII